MVKTLLVFVGILISGCTSITSIKGGCGTNTNSALCMGSQLVPEGQEELFSKASTQAIDAIGSQQFNNEIKRFYLQSAETGQHAKAWEGVDVDIVQNALLSEIQGLEIDTYGGIISGFKYLIYGNIAYDGMTDKPISLNRWALPRSSDSIANTIAHEAAHRIGLKHPHSNDNFGVAKCEPPYVIGSIVEKVIDPENWEPNNHCNLLERQELILSAEVNTTN